MLNTLLNWEFLDEPAKRWFLFFGLIIVINLAWKLIIDTMKGIAS